VPVRSERVSPVLRIWVMRSRYWYSSWRGAGREVMMSLVGARRRRGVGLLVFGFGEGGLC
jgi:hypothetical protein